MKKLFIAVLALSVFTTAVYASDADRLAASILLAPTPTSNTKSKEELEKDAVKHGKFIQKQMKNDEMFWKVGDYEVVLGDLRFGKYKKNPNAHAYGIKNTRTGKFVSNPNQRDNKDIKNGEVITFRDLESIEHYNTNQKAHGYVRLVPDPDGTFGGKPLVGFNKVSDTYIFDKKWKWPQDIKRYKNHPKKDFSVWFQIDENDELQPLDLMPYEADPSPWVDFYSLTADPRHRHYVFVNKDGKQGLYDITLTDTVSRAGQVIPIVCDPNTIKRTEEKPLGIYYTCEVNGKEITFLNGNPFNMNILKEYNDIIVRTHQDFGTLIYVKKLNTWGAVLPDGKVVMPLVADRESIYWDNINIYTAYSYTTWLNRQIKNFLKKGKYEKEADYKARTKDKETVQRYMATKLKGIEKQYFQEYAPKDGRVFKPLNYDAEKEAFVGSFYWNKYEIPVPLNEAEAFEKAFDKVAATALQTAKYKVLNDVIAIDDITFTMPNGKKYHGHMAK